MLHVEASAEVVKPLVALLASGSDLPVVEFFEDHVYLCTMNPSKTVMYEVDFPAKGFDAYEVEKPPVYVELEASAAKRFLAKKKAKEKVSFSVEKAAEQTWLTSDGETVGRIVDGPARPEATFDDVLKTISPLNRLKVDGEAFRPFLNYSEKAGCTHVGTLWAMDGPKVYAFNEEVTVKTRFKDFIEWRVVEEAKQSYDIHLLLAHLPPSAVSKASTLTFHGSTKDNHPIYVECDRLKPEGVFYRFIVAPLIVMTPELVSELLKPPPTPEAEAVMLAEQAEAFFDILSARETFALTFDLDGVKSRALDPSHVTLTDVTLKPTVKYSAPGKPLVCVLTMEGDRVKALLRTGKPTEEVSLAISGKDLLLKGVKIGEVGEVPKPPEPKIKFSGSVGWDAKLTPGELSRLMSDMAKKGAFGFGLIFEPGSVRMAFYGEEFYEEVPVAGEAKEAALSGFKLDLVRAIFPPSAVSLASKWGVPYSYVSMYEANAGPLMIEYEPWGDFKVVYYVAPEYAVMESIARRAGWLKPLTEEAVLEAIRARLPERSTKDNIEDYLLRRFVDVKDIWGLLKKMVKEGKLVPREAGWVTYYDLPERPPTFKPLTEEVVLETIRRLCEEWDTDAVGYSELEAVLAKDYQIIPLHDILHGLRDKGLVDFKAWPERRTGYVVDMRGFWYLKPSKPEEAVKKAEEVKLKELTREAVVEALRKLHEEVALNVYVKPGLWDRLADEGYDTTKLNDVLAELQKEGVVKLWPDGRVWLVEWYEEKVKPKPPPVPEGYARVHFLRDMVKYIGMDRKYYGPFKACEEAVIEKPFAEAFRRAGYVETRSSSEGEAKPTPGAERTWEEAKREYMKWKVE